MDISLADVKAGRKAIIKQILGGKGIHHKLELLGIRTGTLVTKVSDPVLPGAIVVQVGGSQVALGYGIMKRIIVEELP